MKTAFHVVSSWPLSQFVSFSKCYGLDLTYPSAVTVTSQLEISSFSALPVTLCKSVSYYVRENANQPKL